MSVIPRKLLLLILVSLVCVLFILIYGAQLQRGDEIIPNTETSTQSAQKQETCPRLQSYPADIETSNVFPTLDLTPSWMSRREFWGNEYEDRYVRRKSMWAHLPLRVIVMPHSHNDPGWLKTVEGYFALSTKSILTNIVNKLTEHKNMTFIWSEASYMFMWWEEADTEARNKLRVLLDSGRLEITTGGWVMTDEANVDFFSMVDQLVEGHEFMRRELGVVPSSSWSVDSFGHGGAFPHLLAKSEINNMVIMRIHYAWKEWLARHQTGDFLWKQSWEKDANSAPLCHNFPYDIYSIKHSCGPNPQTCLGFDFRHLDGEYNEFTAHYSPINQGNLKERAELLLEQYGRTGSLLPHNVVLVPLGDDFRYSNELEFDQQYSNYIKIMEHINSGKYNAHISFGTLKDYFSEVRSRMNEFPTLTGDFHVYSDIFSEGQPAYWSGYYFTRPYTKLLSRQVSSKLRGVEILYSIAMGMARRGDFDLPMSALVSMYKNLVSARRSLALFQHHDAITGTSKGFVMDDYEQKLDNALEVVNGMEVVLVHYLIQERQQEIILNRPLLHTNRRNKGENWQEETVLHISPAKEHKIVLFNSLAHSVYRAGHFQTNNVNLCVFDEEQNLVDSQISPVFNITGKPSLSFQSFNVWFVVELEALSIAVYTVKECTEARKPTKVYCKKCRNSEKYGSFHLKSIPDGAIQLENQIYKLLFDPESRLLNNVTNKVNGVSKQINLDFSSYTSQFYRSGAYLFAVEMINGVPTETKLFSFNDIVETIIVSGPVFSELKVLWQVTGVGGIATFLHTVRLHHDTGPLSEAIHIENQFDFGPSPNFRDTEFFMRFETGVKNGEENVMFTDQAGLGMVRRVYAEQAGLEGNYYPVTESVYIEDDETRLTLLIDHASGVSSRREGLLEIMVDKRTMNDDARGMGEGVLDSRRTLHRYTLLMEPISPKSGKNSETIPFLSPLALRLSRYLEHPLTSFIGIEKNQKLVNKRGLINSALPCDYDLVNLRTWSPIDASNPSHALLILRRLAPDCSWSSLTVSDCLDPTSVPDIKFSNVSAFFQPTSLTGNHRVSQPYLFKLSPMEISSYNVTFT